MTSDYEAVGGAPAIKSVVEDFYRRVILDPALAHYFTDVDLNKLKGHQAALISQVMGGPREYTGRDLKAAHAHLGITSHDFSKVAVHLLGALNDAGVPEEIATRTGIAIMTYRDIVTRPKR